MIAGGGTGGHLFPALAVADELRARYPNARIAFIGSRRGIEASLLPRTDYPHRLLALGGLKGRTALRRIVAAAGAGWAVLRCSAWMLGSRPSLVIGVGGYASGPAVLAAVGLRVPTMILEQNHFPGATNRWLAPRVDAVCVPSEEAARRIRGRRFVTGNPVRGEFSRIGDPPPDRPLHLLVFGGSRGARSINRVVTEAMDGLRRLDPVPHLVLQTGPDDLQRVRRAWADYPADRCEVHAFLDDMPARLAAADLVLCRAGATTVAELAAAGRAAILVPFPFAADDHQTHNARALERAGAAIVVADAELDAERVVRYIEQLAGDRQRLLSMGRAARTLARPDATRRIAGLAEALVRRRPLDDADAWEDRRVS